MFPKIDTCNCVCNAEKCQKTASLGSEVALIKDLENF